MKTPVFIYGTRPEFIKLYPIIKCFRRDKVLLISTGQHGKMLDDIHELFNINPDIDFELLKNGTAGLNYILSACVKNIEAVLNKLDRPIIVVQGDTESALAGAMAAFNLGFKVCHVEAGLRSFKKNDPFPEEMNRILIDNLSDIMFTPTFDACNNLLGEEVSGEIRFTGNTIIDSVNSIRLKQCKKTKVKTILVTCHRREHLHEKKRNLHKALSKLSRLHDVEIKYIAHPNFSTKKINNVELVEPQAYDAFLQIINDCYFVLTDSGGLQEEAAILGKPCLVMRDNTERQESVDLGVSKLIGWRKKSIYDECIKLITNETEYNAMVNPESKYLYGKPGAGKRIYDIIKGYAK